MGWGARDVHVVLSMMGTLRSQGRQMCYPERPSVKVRFMTPVRCFIPTLLVVLLAGALPAQTVVEPPKFNGSRSTASSSKAVSPTDPQRAGGRQNVTLPGALVGAAAFEAAREEGRIFIEERRLETHPPETD